MMTAAKSSKGKKPKVRTSKERKRLKSGLQPLLETGWLEKKAKALRKKVGLPEEGLHIAFEKGEDWWEELCDWWAIVAARAQREYPKKPPEENPLHIFQEGIERILEESRLKDRVWREFFAGYVVGYLKTIDDMPLPARGYISTVQVGSAGDVETVIRLSRLRGIPTVREMSDLRRTLEKLDAIWQTDWVPPQQREDARIYELVETRQNSYPFDVDDTPGPVSPRAAMRQIAIRRLREKYRPFGDDMVFSEKELDQEFYDVRNAYDREEKRRKASGD